MINKLEMKAIKLAQWKSQETYCYEANVYLDGKPFAIVGNDGHGGCDYQHEHPKFKGEFYPTLKKLNEENLVAFKYCDSKGEVNEKNNPN